MNDKLNQKIHSTGKCAALTWYFTLYDGKYPSIPELFTFPNEYPFQWLPATAIISPV